jgi:peptide/nickel transport system substrate-binding protein
MHDASRAPRRRAPRFILIAMLMLAMMVAPLGAMTRAQDAPSGGTLTGAFDQGPGGCAECFNPFTAGAGFTWFEQYFSKLMLYDIDFTGIQPNLAESWEVSEDGLTVTLKLRQDVLWHDGEAFTSEDVKFTIELAKHPDSASYIGAKFNGVSAIETPDDYTVVLTLEAPNAPLFDAFTFLVIVPQHELADVAPADLVQGEWWRTNPIGTGPFKWSEYVPGQYVELVANEDYFMGRPQLDRLINRYFPEAGSAVIALRNGEIQFSYLTADEALALGEDETIRQYSGPSQVPNYLAFNLSQERFQNASVRQAFAYAIDKNTIIEQLFQGTAQPLMCLFSLPQYVPDGLNAYEYNVEQARSLLEEGGWDGSSIEILTYYTDQLSIDILTAIQQFYADAGVEITFVTVDVNTYNQRAADGDYDMVYAGAANGPDPDVLSTHFESVEQNPNVLNRSGIKNADIDAGFLAGRQATNPDDRAAAYQDVCTVMNSELYWIPLWISTRFGGVNGEGEFYWTPAPGGGRYYQASETWTLKAAE